MDHVVIIDGTKSRLEAGEETNAGILYKLLTQAGDAKSLRVHYDPGVQGHGLWNWVTIAAGVGINKSICAAYNEIATRYQKGDRIFLFGFSRGAYAVRSVAGMISEIGLVKRTYATERVLKQAFRLYERKAMPGTVEGFRANNCHVESQIDMIGVWDTVKALGLPYPVLSRLAPMATNFHNECVGAPVKRAYQALAMHETRQAYRPVLWETDPEYSGEIEQVWFRGVHSDIGGHVYRFPPARNLANVSLAWMLDKVEDCGLALPKDWQKDYPKDGDGPSVGRFRGMAKLFWLRERRKKGEKCCEFIHPSAVKYLREDDPVLPMSRN
ncbi:MAG: DUF2235 domain-containing protein [Pseudomonadota bacterium]